MGAIDDRLSEILRASRDLERPGADVAKLIEDDNADAILSGQDCRGADVAALAASTLKTRKGSGPPRAPSGGAARMITGLIVTTIVEVGRIVWTKRWKDDWTAYHVDGTPSMPARDPSGVRPATMEAIRQRLMRHFTGGRIE